MSQTGGRGTDKARLLPPPAPLTSFHSLVSFFIAPSTACLWEPPSTSSSSRHCTSTCQGKETLQSGYDSEVSYDPHGLTETRRHPPGLPDPSCISTPLEPNPLLSTNPLS